MCEDFQCPFEAFKKRLLSTDEEDLLTFAEAEDIVNQLDELYHVTLRWGQEMQMQRGVRFAPPTRTVIIGNDVAKVTLRKMR